MSVATAFAPPTKRMKASAAQAGGSTRARRHDAAEILPVYERRDEQLGECDGGHQQEGVRGRWPTRTESSAEADERDQQHPGAEDDRHCFGGDQDREGSIFPTPAGEYRAPRVERAHEDEPRRLEPHPSLLGAH